MDSHKTPEPLRGWAVGSDADGKTRLRTVDDYLLECGELIARGHRPFQPGTMDQWHAAYAQGLIENRPAAGEPGADWFDEFDQLAHVEPLSRLEQERHLHTLAVNAPYRRAFRRLLGLPS